ncbi:MAG TPA: hypothetical protein VHC67_04815 [Gaiellaceae bacterium]|nr:hypothetical protein [Gaiellaceae bacterium]
MTKRRLVHNEEVFRAINDEVREAHAPPEDGKVAFLCECADRSCTEKVRLAADEYRWVRADPNRFVVAPGHVLPELEHVVERHDGYEVVEKDVRAA